MDLNQANEYATRELVARVTECKTTTGTPRQRALEQARDWSHVAFTLAVLALLNEATDLPSPGPITAVPGHNQCDHR